MPTMVDVARLARVSVSTVSHVVNGTRNVEPATRGKVERAIREIGYRPDALARAMKRSRTDSVGLVVSDPAEPAFAEMVRGVEMAAAARGLTLLLAATGEDPGRERASVQALISRRVDGLVLAPCDRDTTSLIGAGGAGSSAPVPAVLMDRLHPVDLDQVGVKNAEAMAELVRHLRSRGHRRLALVAGDLGVPTLRERHDSFVAAAGQGAVVLAGDRDARGACATTLGVLGQAAPPTAVVAASTPLAAGALEAIQTRGLRVPGDIALAAFDGFPYPDLLEPRITTVHQPAIEVGRQALELLVDRIENPGAPTRTLRLTATLALRASTDRTVDT